MKAIITEMMFNANSVNNLLGIVMVWRLSSSMCMSDCLSVHLLAAGYLKCWWLFSKSLTESILYVSV